MKKLRVLSLFSGIGAFEKALTNLHINYELVGFSEIDKYAINSYCIIHDVNKNNNLGDISQLDLNNIPNCDLMTWGFPCQDISIAGKMRGIKEGTRSGLYYEGFKILEKIKPKYSIIENVKNLTGKKFKANFESMLDDVESLGYNNYWKVLNAKDYGIPQNRERVFIVSIRKDIDTETFNFPKKFDNKLKLKDFLEDRVDEKFYLSKEYTNRFIKSLTDEKLQDKTPHGNAYTVLRTTVDTKAKGINSRHWVYDINHNISTLDATMYKQPKQILETTNKMIVVGSTVHNEYIREKMFPDNKRQVKINGEIYYNPQNEYYKEIKSNKYLGYIGNQPKQATKVYDIEHESTTLTANGGGQGGKTGLYHLGYAIRKLTPLECWRLMGFDDEDFYKAKSQGVSNTQLYKQAGNSIVVNCLYYIFKELFKDYIK